MKDTRYSILGKKSLKIFGSLKKLLYIYKTKEIIDRLISTDKIFKLLFFKFFTLLKIFHIVSLSYIVTNGRIWSINKLGNKDKVGVLSDTSAVTFPVRRD
jgi:hypothetical protein